MQNKLNHENMNWLAVITYPIHTLFTTPVAFFATILNSGVLILKRGCYPHFNMWTALNSMFYWVRALNLQRYGRYGKSPYLGLGDYEMSRCFHYSKISLFSYWKFGAVIVLLSMFCWFFMHLLYFGQIEIKFFLISTLFILFSVQFYANTFRFQNYNVMGWAFFPVLFFGLLTNNIPLVFGGLLLVSFTSFTVFVICAIIVVAASFIQMEIKLIYALIIPSVVIAGNFLPLFTNKDASKILKNVLKAIGFSDGKAVYKRKAAKKLNIKNLYHLVLFVQFTMVYGIVDQEIPYLLIVANLIYLNNILKFRFADEQSMYMLHMSMALPYTLLSGDFIVLISLVLLIYPLPGLTGFDMFKNGIYRVPILKPYNIAPLFSATDAFMEKVPENSRILMCYNDPQGLYENVFDGQRRIYEVLQYRATHKNIHLLPDWWAVFELNYEGAPNIWGVDFASIQRNVSKWDAQYFIISNTDMSDNGLTELTKMGHEHISTFSWDAFEQDFNRYSKLPYDELEWLLFKAN